MLESLLTNTACLYQRPKSESSQAVYKQNKYTSLLAQIAVLSPATRPYDSAAELAPAIGSWYQC